MQREEKRIQFLLPQVGLCNVNKPNFRFNFQILPLPILYNCSPWPEIKLVSCLQSGTSYVSTSLHSSHTSLFTIIQIQFTLPNFLLGLLFSFLLCLVYCCGSSRYSISKLRGQSHSACSTLNSRFLILKERQYHVRQPLGKGKKTLQGPSVLSPSGSLDRYHFPSLKKKVRYNVFHKNRARNFPYLTQWVLKKCLNKQMTNVWWFVTIYSVHL